MLAGASLSERLTQSEAKTARPPASMKKPKSRRFGVSHPNGTMTIPNTTVPTNCIDANMTSGVPRRERVTTIRNANATLPPSAMTADQSNTPADGRSAIRTP
jgi:hypothetical protein